MAVPDLTTDPLKIGEMLIIGASAGYIGGKMGQNPSLPILSEVIALCVGLVILMMVYQRIMRWLDSLLQEEDDKEDRLEYGCHGIAPLNFGF